MDTPTKTTNIPSVSALDEVLGNVTIDGVKRTRRQTMGSLAAQLAGSGAISAALTAINTSLSSFAEQIETIETGSAEGIIFATTLADLNARATALGLGAGDAGRAGRVYEDSTTANNGDWRWTGSAWDFLGLDRIGQIEVGLADAGADLAAEVATREALIDETVATTGELVDDDGAAALGVSDEGVSVPGALLDAGVDVEFSVVDDAGFTAFEASRDGFELPGGVIDAGFGDEFSVVDENGAPAFETRHDGPHIPGYEHKLLDLFQPPKASMREPDSRVVEIGGYLRINRPAIGANPSPFVDSPATISQDTANMAYAKRNYQMAPTTAWIPMPGNANGRWWVLFYGGYDADETITPQSEFPGTIAIGAYSDNLGATWTEAFYIVPGPLPLRVWDSSIAAIGDRLYIRYGYGAGLNGGSASNGGLSGFTDGYSAGYGVWLENPIAVKGKLVFGKHHFAELGLGYNFFKIDGKWHIPISVHPKMLQDRLTDEAGRWVYRFHPDASAYERVFATPYEETYAHQDFDERQVVQLNGGILLAQWRSSAGIYQSIRNADGVWSNPSIWTGVVPNANSKHYLGRSPSGRLVSVICNSVTRENLTIALSEDDGATWPVEMRAVIYPGGCSYQTVAFDDSGNILVTFDAGRGPPSASIRCSAVAEADIVAGTASPAVNIISLNPNI